MKQWSVVIILIFTIGSIISVLYALVFRSKASCFQPDSNGVAEVKAVSWNANTRTLSFKQGFFVLASLTVSPPKPMVVITVNKQGEKRNERVVFPSSGKDWQTAFCAGDTLWLVYKNTSKPFLPAGWHANRGPRGAGRHKVFIALLK